MIRKPLAVGALFASVILMSACGGSSSTTTSTTTPATTETAAVEPSSEASSTPIEEAPVYAGDLGAKADASLLGKNLATWYVDNSGEAPAITVEGGRYFFDGTDIGAVTPDVEFGGQAGTSFDDWCVWVTNPRGDLKDFQYSAVGGLEAGTCEG